MNERSVMKAARKGIAISILSFNRPDYLAKTLVSLNRQLSQNDRVFLFQDGAFNLYSRRWKSDQKKVDDCVEIFRSLMPTGTVFISPYNLGIAGNYRRAEDHCFSVRDFSEGLFLEDDLILSNNYLAVTDYLLNIAGRNHCIGYVSAYGNFWASLDQQFSQQTKLVPMHENWGFAMTKSSWLKQARVRETYYRLVDGDDYSHRDHSVIRGWYASMGYNMPVTSQDGSRWIACAEERLARLTTATCHAVYIGREGEHFTPSYYDSLHFDRAVCFPFVPEFEEPAQNDIERWINEETDNLRNGYRHSYIDGQLEASEHGIKSKYEIESENYIDLIHRQGDDYVSLSLRESRDKYFKENEALRSELAHANSVCSQQILSADQSLQETARLSLKIGELLARQTAFEKEQEKLVAERDTALTARDLAERERLRTHLMFVELARWTAEYRQTLTASLSWKVTRLLRILGVGRPRKVEMPEILRPPDAKL